MAQQRTSSPVASSSAEWSINRPQPTGRRSWSTWTWTRRWLQPSRCWLPKIESPLCETRAGDPGNGNTAADFGRWITRRHQPRDRASHNLAAADLARRLRSRSRSVPQGSQPGWPDVLRDRRPLREVVLDQSLPLSAEEDPRRRFLPGFTKPGSAVHFDAVWEDLAEAFDRLADVEIDVIIDCGRMGPFGPPPAMLERSALTAVVVTSTLRSIMSARVHLPTLRDHPRLSSSERGRLGLIVVGEGQPYRRGEIAKALDVPVIASIAYDRQAAAHLSDGRPRHRRFDATPLMRSVRDASSQLCSILQRSAELVGG